MRTPAHAAPTARGKQRAKAHIPAAVWGAIALLMLTLGGLLWGVAMRRGLNHDEHQFIAGAALIAREGLTPYADFPYFHVPLLSLIYAALFQFASHLLLTARALSVGSAWLTLGLLLATGYRVLGRQGPWLRFAHGAAGALLLAFTPLFVYTSGRAWNHDLPLLCALLAAVLVLDGLNEPHPPRSGWPIFCAGLLLGLASITRASFALLIPAYLAGVWLGPAGSWRGRSKAIVWFAAGGLLGALPALILLARAPAGFLFGNLTYVQLNTAYYLSQNATYPGMTLPGKLGVAGQLLITQPANLLPVLTFVIAGAGAWARGTLWQRKQLITLSLLVVAAVLGALAATPAQTQYFYAPLPFLVLGTLYAIDMWPAARQRAGVGLMGGAALLALLLTGRSYAPGLAILAQPDEWYPRKVHARGAIIADLAGSQTPVLTLAPTHVLEGGLPIYPEFATGPFAWRVADLIPPAERAALQLVGPAELAAYLTVPPRALLTSLDNDDVAEEAPLIDFAQANGYMPVQLPDEGTLWLAPQAEWGGLVRLGAVTPGELSLLPGEEAVVTLYLQAMQPIDRNLNLLVRLVGPGGEELWRTDGWPYGSPTSTWQVGEVWPSGYTITIPGNARPGIYTLEASFYDPATLDPAGETVTVSRVAVGPRPAVGPVQATLGESITLHDAAVSARPDKLDVTLSWQAQRSPPADLVRFVQVLDASGQVAAQQDGPVLDGFLPTRHWPLNWPIQERIEFVVPPGDYTVIAGFYDPATLARLPVHVNGQAVADHVVIGAVTVAASQ